MYICTQKAAGQKKCQGRHLNKIRNSLSGLNHMEASMVSPEKTICMWIREPMYCFWLHSSGHRVCECMCRRSDRMLSVMLGCTKGRRWARCEPLISTEKCWSKAMPTADSSRLLSQEPSFISLRPSDQCVVPFRRSPHCALIFDNRLSRWRWRHRPCGNLLTETRFNSLHLAQHSFPHTNPLHSPLIAPLVPKADGPKRFGSHAH